MRTGIQTSQIHIQRIKIIYLVAGANLYIVIQNDVIVTSSRRHCDHTLEIFQSFTASSISRDRKLHSEIYAIFMTQEYAISQN